MNFPIILALVSGNAFIPSSATLSLPPAVPETIRCDRQDQPAASSPPYTAEIASLGLIGVYPLHQKDWASAPNSRTFLLSHEFGRRCTEAAERDLERHDPTTASIRRKNRNSHLEYTSRGHLFFNMDNTIEWYLSSTGKTPGMSGGIGARGTCRYTFDKNRIILEFTVEATTSTLLLPIENTASPSGSGRLCIDLSDPAFGRDVYPEIPVVIEKHTPSGTIIQKTPFYRFGTHDTYNHNIIATSWNDDETAVLVTQHWKWNSEIYLYAETANHRYIRSKELSEECTASLERHIHAALPGLARKRARIAHTYPYALQGTMHCRGNHAIAWQMASYMPKSENMDGDFHTDDTFHYCVKAGKLCLAPEIRTLQNEQEPTGNEQETETEQAE